MRAAKKAGHVGKSFRRAAGPEPLAVRPRPARGGLVPAALERPAAWSMKARVVRHQGTRFRSAPLPKHVAYLKREGVTRDGAERAHVRRRAPTTPMKGLRRALRGGPAPFPLHHLARGCGRAGRPRDLHPRTDAGCRARSRHQARLGRGRSLEHRQPAHPRPDPRPRRRRPGPGHQPRLHQPRLSRSRRRARDVGAWSAQRAGDPRCLEKEVEAERWTSLDRALRDISDEGGGGRRPATRRRRPKIRSCGA